MIRKLSMKQDAYEQNWSLDATGQDKNYDIDCIATGKTALVANSAINV